MMLKFIWIEIKTYKKNYKLNEIQSLLCMYLIYLLYKI